MRYICEALCPFEMVISPYFDANIGLNGPDAKKINVRGARPDSNWNYVIFHRPSFDLIVPTGFDISESIVFHSFIHLLGKIKPNGGTDNPSRSVTMADHLSKNA